MARYSDNHNDYEQDVHDMSSAMLDYLLGNTHQNVDEASELDEFGCVDDDMLLELDM